jgi:hypothetical protein
VHRGGRPVRETVSDLGIWEVGNVGSGGGTEGSSSSCSHVSLQHFYIELWKLFKLQTLLASVSLADRAKKKDGKWKVERGEQSSESQQLLSARIPMERCARQKIRRNGLSPFLPGGAGAIES